MSKPSQKSKDFVMKPSQLGALMFLTGRATDAALLNCMMTWARAKLTLKDEQGEEGWNCYSREQWMVNSGLSLQQYNDSIKRLKNKYIKYKHRRLRKTDKGRATLWVKILPETYEQMEKIAQGITCVRGGGMIVSEVVRRLLESTNPYVAFRLLDNPPHSSPETTKMAFIESSYDDTLIKEEIFSKNSQIGKRCKSPLATHTTASISNTERDSGEGILVDESTGSIREKTETQFTKTKSGRNSKTSTESLLTVEGFENYWHKLEKEKYPDFPTVSWTEKYRAYARAFISRLRENPNLDIANLIETIMGDWSSASRCIKEERGMKFGPVRPSIGFVAASPQETLNWYIDQKLALGRPKRRSSLKRFGEI